LFSPFTPVDCAKRLREAVDEGAMVSFFRAGSKPVIGKVSEFSLTLNKRINYRNSYQPYLTATMRPELGGTAISGVLAMHPFVRIFNVVWFGFVTIIFLGMGWASLSGKRGDSRETSLMLIVPLGMLCFGIGLIWFGRFLARNEPKFLEDFLIQTLDARRNSREKRE
jgi:hypothetical protein